MSKDKIHYLPAGEAFFVLNPSMTEVIAMAETPAELHCYLDGENWLASYCESTNSYSIRYDGRPMPIPPSRLSFV
jgi:hypothetical protein